MSIKSRLVQVEQQLRNKNGDFMMVCITDDNGFVASCNQHREGCPDLPCDGSNCWARKAHPDMKTINVANDNEGDGI